MLYVDPWHWLDSDGELPRDNLPLRRQALRIARFIEYGAELAPGEVRLTLVECRRRPGRRPCLGLMMVLKNPDDTLEAGCPECGEPEVLIRNWQDTFWAHGLAQPLPPLEG